MIREFDIFKPYADKIEQGLLKDFEAMPEAITAEQMHADSILELTKRPDTELQCDGFITKTRDLPIMIKAADCQGVLIYDPTHEVIAAIHSGWRGSAKNIIGKAVQKMKSAHSSNPEGLMVAISPSLGPCCAEFSDPRNELPASCHRFIRDNNHVDFWALSLVQLKEEGVPRQNIELSGKCTKCQPGYHSHRNGGSGRMGIFVKLK